MRANTSAPAAKRNKTQSIDLHRHKRGRSQRICAACRRRVLLARLRGLSSGGGRPVAAPAHPPCLGLAFSAAVCAAAEHARHELLPARAVVRRERAAGQPPGQQVRDAACGAARCAHTPSRSAWRRTQARTDALCPAAPPSSASPSARTPWRATCSSSRRQSKPSCWPRAVRLLPSCARLSPKLSRRAQEASSGVSSIQLASSAAVSASSCGSCAASAAPLACAAALPASLSSLRSCSSSTTAS